jgi:hypothetical protein
MRFVCDCFCIATISHWHPLLEPLPSACFVEAVLIAFHLWWIQVASATLQLQLTAEVSSFPVL